MTHLSLLRIELIRLLIVAGGILLDIGRSWNTLAYKSIQSIPNRLKLVTRVVSMQAMEHLG
jgi:hypothetical protein